MTKRIDNGTGARRIALDMQDVCYQKAKLITAAVDDLLDGDHDTRTALEALNELGFINYRENGVHGRIADRALMDAETEAQQLAASHKGGKAP